MHELGDAVDLTQLLFRVQAPARRPALGPVTPVAGGFGAASRSAVSISASSEAGSGARTGAGPAGSALAPASVASSSLTPHPAALPESLPVRYSPFLCLNVAVTLAPSTLHPNSAANRHLLRFRWLRRVSQAADRTGPTLLHSMSGMSRARAAPGAATQRPAPRAHPPRGLAGAPRHAPVSWATCAARCRSAGYHSGCCHDADLCAFVRR